MLDNPSLILSEPRSVFAVFILEGDTGFPVVNLFTTETLVSRHERRTGQSRTSAVGCFGVVVIRHCVSLSRK